MPFAALPEVAGRGTVVVMENLGHEAYAFVETAEGRLCLRLDRGTVVRHGDVVQVEPLVDACHLFDTGTGQRIAA